MSTLQFSPSPSPTRRNFLHDDSDNNESDKASQRSISLSSPRSSIRSHNGTGDDEPFHRQAQFETPKASDLQPSEKPMVQRVLIDSESTETKGTFMSPSNSSVVSADETRRSSQTSVTTSSIKYPPQAIHENDTASMVSYASSSSRKARPESMLVQPPAGPIVPGIALVDFNHLVGPKIEFCEGAVFDDEQLVTILPFLALPDGAHLSSEDYSYFHLVPTSPHPTTIFGISCNRQIKAADLMVKGDDVTRSIVQKAVVVLASKPFFGPIRDRLGVVTQALFSQRDFRETGILVDFKSSLEMSLRNQLTESALYMGTNLRELVHKFRSRTLLLLKSLMLQKRIMFYGHPVERLCTYQYSLISLIPGLLQNLDDCGSPPLASRARTLSPPTSLRTSDRKSLMAYLGLPLDIFGKDAFFQPYLPLQQVDLIKETRSFVCGSTNSIVTQQKEVDLLVNIETNTFEFRDSQLERLVALTPADRKWMDEIVKDVNESWDDVDTIRPVNMQFKGSDDYIRTKFEEYITAALSSVKYADFLAKSSRSDVIITGADGGDSNAIQDFNPQWIAAFRRTNAFEVWNRITDPMVFDIVEARHPCSGKSSVVEDIGLRLQEGLQDLNLQEQLAPTREAISKTFVAGSTNFLKAVEGVRGRWAQRSAGSSEVTLEGASSASSPPVEISQSEIDLAKANAGNVPNEKLARSSTFSLSSSSSSSAGLRPLSLSTASPPPMVSEAKAAIGTWGASIGSFISQRTARFSVPRTNSNGSTSASAYSGTGTESQAGSPPMNEVVASKRASNSGNGSISPPLPSLFSSWSFGKATATSTKPAESVLNGDSQKSVSVGPTDESEGQRERDKQEGMRGAKLEPMDIGEFDDPPKGPATTSVRSDNDSGSDSAVTQPGLAL